MTPFQELALAIICGSIWDGAMLGLIGGYVIWPWLEARARIYRRLNQ